MEGMVFDNENTCGTAEKGQCCICGDPVKKSAAVFPLQSRKARAISWCARKLCRRILEAKQTPTCAKVCFQKQNLQYLGRFVIESGKSCPSLDNIPNNTRNNLDDLGLRAAAAPEDLTPLHEYSESAEPGNDPSTPGNDSEEDVEPAELAPYEDLDGNDERTQDVTDAVLDAQYMFLTTLVVNALGADTELHNEFHGLLKVITTIMAKAKDSGNKAHVKATWSKRRRELVVDFGDSKNITVGFSKKIPVQLQLDRYVVFTFSELGSEAQVDTRGLSFIPLQGAQELYANGRFKKALYFLLKKDLSLLKPFDNRLDHDLDKFAKVVYESFKQHKGLAPRVMEWLNFNEELLGVAARVMPQVLYDTAASVFMVTPGVVHRLTAVTHNKEIQVHASHEIGPYIPVDKEWKPLLLSEEVQAIKRWSARCTYRAMADATIKPMFSLNKLTKRQAAISTGKGLSAMTWLTVLATDDSFLQGYGRRDMFPGDPRGGGLTPLLKLLSSFVYETQPATVFEVAV
eukprot:TRINITY_DN3948_c2_g2_i1.p1 TRINITY_DN3948_c2_g2~~TRINITY_DN3948_c2_g2_i1.p1  ORF type:complete len:590 (-),score=54.02 TRINITY_DN3948_c2_g2_i1:125-1669(-)